MLLAIDPGRTVGWAFCYHGIVYDTQQTPLEEIWRTLEAAKASEDIEKLIYESWTQRSRFVDLSAIEAIGVIKEWARQNDVTTQGQTSSQGKHFWTDNKLKQVGLLREPKTTWRHANDAMRHLKYFQEFVQGVKS